MKRKMKGVLGAGLALILITSLFGFALPVSAAAPLPTINSWTNFTYPAEGYLGGWFWDHTINELGPMDKALNGDIYTYAQVTGDANGDHKILRSTSTDGGRSWTDSISPLRYNNVSVIGNQVVVDMVCSSESELEDVLYVTDGDYVYKSSDNAGTWSVVGQADLEKILMGDCGEDVINQPITCIDVGYDASNNPYVFIGVKTIHATSLPDILYIDELAIGATWNSLNLSCYVPGVTYTPYAVGVTPDFATAPTKLMAVVTTMALLEKWDETTAEWAIDPAVGPTDPDYRGYVAKFTQPSSAGWGDMGAAKVYYGDTMDTVSNAGLQFTYYTDDNVRPYVVLYLDTDANGLPDTLLINSNVATWVHDGSWQTTIPTDSWKHCTYDESTRETGSLEGTWETLAHKLVTYGGDTLVYVALGYGGPYNGATIYMDDITINGATYSLPGETHVISSNLGVCGWGEVAELVWNCNPVNHFAISHAARIGYPDDYVDGRTLFVGVTATAYDSAGDIIDTAGGDVYSVVTYPVGSSTDLNVAGSSGGCIGLSAGTNVCGLDVCGDTADAAVIAGAMDDTNVYTSIDGGWTWVTSKKDPTGVDETWVQWAGDDCGANALAATYGCDCAVSINCADGLYWNQASLIDTCFSCVQVVDHSPGYYEAGVSDTLFMLTECDSGYSVFRYVGDPALAGTSSPAHPWERVFSSRLYAAEINTEHLTPDGDPIDMLMVSPDFLTTEAVFIGNSYFEFWRSLDAGCSWFKLAFPCAPRPTISAATVVDKETVVAGGSGAVYKTTRHGTRHWTTATAVGAGDAKSFDFDGDTILLGDNSGKVFISSDGALTWSQVGGVFSSGETSVAFDPGYADNNIIYAAAGEVIARFVYGTSTAWTKIGTGVGTAWGISAVGDTTLYVGDRDTDGGMWRTVDATGTAVFEQIGFTGAQISGLPATAGVNGCPDSNVLWATDVCNDTTARVWFFEDTLARPVDLESPSNGATGLSAVIGTTTATITWEALCTATSYEIQVWYLCPGCDMPDYVVDGCYSCVIAPCVGCSGATCCKVVQDFVPADGPSPLLPGTTYHWRVRVCTDSLMLSKWSDTYSFTTAMLTPVRCSPGCGAENITLTPNFSWSEIFGATGYEIEVATNEDFEPIFASGTPTINAWDGVPQLDCSTTYYWRVRSVSPVGAVGAWTYCLFSTEAEPVVPEEAPYVWTCPQCGLTFTSEAALEAHIAEAHAPALTPLYIWIIIGIGAALVIAVIVLVVTTRRVS